MAQLPLPQKGQPITHGDLETIVSTVNDLSTKMSSAVSQSSFVGKTGAKYSQKISEMIVSSAYQDVIVNSTEAKPQTFTVQFGLSFKVPPVVTITPQALNSTTSSKSAIVVITSISQSAVSGVVRFTDTGGQVSVGVNVIAFGVPGN